MVLGLVHLAAVPEKLDGKNVLTVGERKGFAGMDAVGRTALKLSPKLLRLTRIAGKSPEGERQ